MYIRLSYTSYLYAVIAIKCSYVVSSHMYLYIYACECVCMCMYV